MNSNPFLINRIVLELRTMMSRAFYSYGKFCSSHTWEVIVAFLTLTICVFSVAPSDSPRHCIPMSTDGSPTVNTRCYNKVSEALRRTLPAH